MLRFDKRLDKRLTGLMPAKADGDELNRMFAEAQRAAWMRLPPNSENREAAIGRGS